ncbi:MAG: 2-amino-4-hydroxy-6-hydroxymethyldihydropteridine diphosphokinase [Deltaproteobacteria bacterium]|nr:2-amino-4-hydroxy-6-hydroxymethyldihydropteridine diphosphokinase [Deltaproteobacteria bacterium]
MTFRNAVYIGLGSNMGDRAINLEKAVMMLDRHPAITVNVLSAVYETDPVGDVQGGPFLNIAASISTTLEPIDLLKSLLHIEKTMGRVRTPGVVAPRAIDLDILLFEDLLMDTPELTIPHPRLRSRRFVLEPLKELAPLLKIPGTDKTIREIGREVEEKHPEQVIRPMGRLGDD